MSKIQKALGRLRNDERKPQSESAVQDDRPTRAAAELGRQSRKRRYLPLVDDFVESPPQHSIQVDFEYLVDCGLQIDGSDLDRISQQFRRIKRPILNIAFGDLGQGAENANVIMITSALPKSGKTFCSYNLALSISRERDVGAVVVDADVLKPNISRAFGVAERTGLIDYLLDSRLTLEDILIGTDLQNIVVVPSGQRHEEATELLASRRMEQFVNELSARFPTRAVIVDTPPLLLTNEAHVLSERMGQIIMVIEAGETLQESVSTALDMLDREKPINAIMNKTRGRYGEAYSRESGDGYYAYYQSTGGHGSEDE